MGINASRDETRRASGQRLGAADHAVVADAFPRRSGERLGERLRTCRKPSDDGALRCSCARGTPLSEEVSTCERFFVFALPWDSLSYVDIENYVFPQRGFEPNCPFGLGNRVYAFA